MNVLKPICLMLSYCLIFNLSAQINFTAKDIVPEYNGAFRLGVNPGYHGPEWGDVEMANIAAGNSSLGIEGAGVQAFRAPLPHFFMIDWGYDVQVDDYEGYANVGMADHVSFIGYPHDD